ncbi:MAG: lipoyl synthase [Myxococcales bacterium]|nr:lipoyl synthase [Myxococcales bacterium]MCB9520001.1 lipoyl synthase [Myxococcales bacterium]MCB9534360.1 lipoyl synthase [Myxococcales bacterium]
MPVLQARPPWPRKKLVHSEELREMKSVLRRHSVRSVCEDAKCPNMSECFGRREATFIVLGDVCTRRCGFCAIPTGKPNAPDPSEPSRVAAAARELGLRHVVITTVARDDLRDGGAAHIAACVNAVRGEDIGATVEVLTSDFRGDRDALAVVAGSDVQIFNHNVETVPRLQRSVRPQARFDRSLDVLHHVKSLRSDVVVKSGLMLGLGESDEEVQDTLRALREARVDVVTIGQYLQPLGKNADVVGYSSLERFDQFAELGAQLGFALTLSAPYVRSSFGAAEAARVLGITSATDRTHISPAAAP